jgi:segregation and condensation protein A
VTGGEAALVLPEADAAGWEDPPHAARSTGPPVLSVDGFEGPLDWLLELARAQKIDLARLPIASLIESFAEALETALARRDGQAPRLERWGEWLVMAATLTWLRSRLLVPDASPDGEQALDEAEDLRRALVARQHIRAATDWLERRPQLGREVFPRGRPEVRASAARGGDIADLLRACLALLRVPEDRVDLYQPRPPPMWGVADALARMQELLGALPAGSPLVAFLPVIDESQPGRPLRSRAAVASTLVAGLELARSETLSLEQDAAWAQILVFERTGQPTAPD